MICTYIFVWLEIHVFGPNRCSYNLFQFKNEIFNPFLVLELMITNDCHTVWDVRHVHHTASVSLRVWYNLLILIIIINIIHETISQS